MKLLGQTSAELLHVWVRNNIESQLSKGDWNGIQSNLSHVKISVGL